MVSGVTIRLSLHSTNGAHPVAGLSIQGLGNWRRPLNNKAVRQIEPSLGALRRAREPTFGETRSPRCCAMLRGSSRLWRAAAQTRRFCNTPTQGASWEKPAALGVGVLSGSIGSFVGIGGALIMVPLTCSVFGLRQLTANATALFPNVGTCASSAFAFSSEGDVDWTAASLVAVSAVASTRVGARLAHRLPERTSKLLFGSAMLVMAPVIAFKQHLRREQPAEPTESVRPGLRVPSLREAGYMLGLGCATGLCSGVLGIGAGTMVTVGLALGGPAGWSHKLVLGTAFAAQLPPHAMGAFTHWQLGNLRTDLLPWLLAGSTLGAMVASNVAVGVEEEKLRLMFGAYALWLGGSCLRTGWAMPVVAAIKSAGR
jgi:uncharacterized membrane protein YfcA